MFLAGPRPYLRIKSVFTLRLYMCFGHGVSPISLQTGTAAVSAFGPLTAHLQVIMGERVKT